MSGAGRDQVPSGASAGETRPKGAGQDPLASGAGPGEARPSGPPAGASLHYGDPWAAPPAERDPLRRLRGHLVLPVTVWLADVLDAGEPAGLTVSSVLIGQGDPGVLAGLVSPLSDLAGAIQPSGAPFVVHVLSGGHQRLAQHFAGELPAPPDLLGTSPSAYGPVLDVVADRAFCRSASARPFGWSLLVEAVVEAVEVSPARNGLAWYHGTFEVLGTGSGRSRN